MLQKAKPKKVVVKTVNLGAPYWKTKHIFRNNEVNRQLTAHLRLQTVIATPEWKGSSIENVRHQFRGERHVVQAYKLTHKSGAVCFIRQSYGG